MPARPGERLRTVLYMLGISLFFTVCVAGVNAALRKGIDENRRLKERRGVLDALGVAIDPGAKPETVLKLAEERLLKRVYEFEEDGEKKRIEYYGERGADGALRACVFPIGGSGYWGPVQGYVAVDPDAKTVVGITFTRHTETPGLGAEITKEWFRSQFAGKPIEPPAEGGLAVRFVPKGSTLGEREVEAITGATGTTRAVQLFLNEDLKRIRKILDAISKEDGAKDPASPGPALSGDQ